MALDTSTPAVTAGLVELDSEGLPHVLAQQVTVNPRGHAELLTPQIQTILTEADRSFADVSALVVGCGPGPFTGLRVGMVTAASLGHACDLPVYPACGLDAIAAEVGHRSPPTRLLVTTDARRGELYWAAYEDGKRLTHPRVDAPTEVAQQATDVGLDYLAGELPAKHHGIVKLPTLEPSAPTPVGLVLSAATQLRAGAAPEPLVPLYLRRPDATEPGPPKPVTTTAAGI